MQQFDKTTGRKVSIGQRSDGSIGYVTADGADWDGDPANLTTDAIGALTASLCPPARRHKYRIEARSIEDVSSGMARISRVNGSLPTMFDAHTNGAITSVKAVILAVSDDAAIAAVQRLIAEFEQVAK